MYTKATYWNVYNGVICWLWQQTGNFPDAHLQHNSIVIPGNSRGHVNAHSTTIHPKTNEARHTHTNSHILNELLYITKQTKPLSAAKHQEEEQWQKRAQEEYEYWTYSCSWYTRDGYTAVFTLWEVMKMQLWHVLFSVCNLIQINIKMICGRENVTVCNMKDCNPSRYIYLLKRTVDAAFF